MCVTLRESLEGRRKLCCDVLLVELVDFLTRVALPVQSLQQQVVRFGRRVIGVFGNLLDLVGVHLVPENRTESDV